jgi:hypothetical protein
VGIRDLVERDQQRALAALRQQCRQTQIRILTGDCEHALVTCAACQRVELTAVAGLPSDLAIARQAQHFRHGAHLGGVLAVHDRHALGCRTQAFGDGVGPEQQALHVAQLTALAAISE